MISSILPKSSPVAFSLGLRPGACGQNAAPQAVLACKWSAYRFLRSELRATRWSACLVKAADGPFSCRPWLSSASACTQ
jgi:hypothetical protein